MFVHMYYPLCSSSLACYCFFCEFFTHFSLEESCSGSSEGQKESNSLCSFMNPTGSFVVIFGASSSHEKCLEILAHVTSERQKKEAVTTDDSDTQR